MFWIDAQQDEGREQGLGFWPGKGFGGEGGTIAGVLTVEGRGWEGSAEFGGCGIDRGVVRI